ncbi:MAG: outer membrane protein assembly factor BamA [Bdellovibrionota bacterium]
MISQCIGRWFVALNIFLFAWQASVFAFSDENKISKVTVRGNAKVESTAILTLLETKAGARLDNTKVKDDIFTLFDLGYFSNIRVFKKKDVNGYEVVFEVAEKPAIVSIEFEGLEEVTEDDLKDKMETKLFKIINESTIASDMRMIEKQYIEKGFYLAKVTYKIEKKNENEVRLKFIIDENGKVLIGDVFVLGNKYFTDADLISKFASQPYTRSAAFSSAALYQDEKVKRDLEFLSYYYRDQGFAEVKVAKPITFLDSDREFVRITFQVEEGIQYNVGKITVTGDLLYEEKELLDLMKLKPGKLFRHSWFVQYDIEMLMNKYRDLGYAYADVNPKTTLRKDEKLVDINYVITKGNKVYFGDISIVGNTKTRDNVIRREFEVNDSELFNGTKLLKSKTNINRLGFFEEVQIIEERDAQQENVLNLKAKVKETHTGQLQAAVGYTPAAATKASWFGQGKYDEKNQSGKGWNTSLTGKFTDYNNYTLDLGFQDPRLNDSYWSLGADIGYEKREARYAQGVDFSEVKRSVSATLGRKIIELIRGSLTLERSQTIQTSEQFILDQFRSDGIKTSVILGLSRRDVDNYLDPTSGTAVALAHRFAGGILGGDYQYMESTFDTKYYIPLDFSETFRTHFKLHGRLGLLWQSGDKKIPFSERYRRGGQNDIMRGFDYASISPYYRVLKAPGDSGELYPKGGDKELTFQIEYFVPLIQEAKIKALVFSGLWSSLRR